MPLVMVTRNKSLIPDSMIRNLGPVLQGLVAGALHVEEDEAAHPLQMLSRCGFLSSARWMWVRALLLSRLSRTTTPVEVRTSRNVTTRLLWG